MPGLLKPLVLAGLLVLGAAARASAGETAVDESGLRYYAAQKQVARVEAETRRLQRLHPGWQPPSDLWTAAPVPEDEAPLFDLLGADKLVELRAAIAKRQTGDRDWRPSPTLANRLNGRELRARALAAQREHRWADIAALAKQEGRGFGAGDVELDWAIAEAFAQTDRPDDASAVYRAIIDAPNATNVERLATIQKAQSLLPNAEAERLIAAVVARGGADQLAPIALDITGARLTAILNDTTTIVLADEALAAFVDHARTAREPNQAALLAWYFYKRHDDQAALTWFKLAIARGGDAMVAHGLAQTLRRLGLKREAEEVAYAWREPLVNNDILFIDTLEGELTLDPPPPIETERLARYARVTLDMASGEGAQALAWYAYNTCRFDTAVDWFKRAMAWYPKETTALGYAITLRRLKRSRAFFEIVNRYDGLFPKVVALAIEETHDARPLPCEAPRPASVANVDLRSPAARRTTAQSSGFVPAPTDVTALRADSFDGRRASFIFPVNAENDLRFADPTEPAIPDVRSRDRDGPLVARRVTGVLSMPYEAAGASLRPGWTGVASASATAAADLPPPKGSAWDVEAREPQTVKGPNLLDQTSRLETQRFQR